MHEICVPVREFCWHTGQPVASAFLEDRTCLHFHDWLAAPHRVNAHSLRGALQRDGEALPFSNQAIGILWACAPQHTPDRAPSSNIHCVAGETGSQRYDRESRDSA